MFDWLWALGYDEALYSVRSRCFMLSVHADAEVGVKVHDAVASDLDWRTNLLVIDKFG